MALDVLQNYAEATVTTALNGTDPAGTSDTVTVSALNGTWVGLGTGQQMRVADKTDVDNGVGYEIMILTADNSGAAGSWTVTRGAEGSTVKAHTANWTLVPVDTAGGLENSLLARPLGLVSYSPATATSYTINATPFTAVDSTNLTVSFTAPSNGNVIVRLSAVALCGNSSTPLGWALLDHTTTTTLYGNPQMVTATAAGAGQESRFTTAVYVTGLTAGSPYQMDWAAGGLVNSTTSTMYVGGPGGLNPASMTYGPAVMEVWAA